MEVTVSKIKKICFAFGTSLWMMAVAILQNVGIPPNRDIWSPSPRQDGTQRSKEGNKELDEDKKWGGWEGHHGISALQRKDTRRLAFFFIMKKGHVSTRPGLHGNLAMPASCSWIPSLQSCKVIHGCCWSCLVHSVLVMVTWADRHPKYYVSTGVSVCHTILACLPCDLVSLVMLPNHRDSCETPETCQKVKFLITSVPPWVCTLGQAWCNYIS